MSIGLREAKEMAQPIIEDAMETIITDCEGDPEAIDAVKRAVCVGLANYKEA